MSNDKKVLDFKKFSEDLGAAELALDAGDYPVAATKLLEVTRNQNELIQMLIHDVIALSNETQKLRAMAINIGSSLSAVTIALEENNILEVAKIQEVWNRELLPTLKKLDEAQAKPEPQKSNILVPTGPKIIVP